MALLPVTGALAKQTYLALPRTHYRTRAPDNRPEQR
jgi:hypothetical protein